MDIRLVIDVGELVKVTLKSGGRKGDGEEVWGLLGFVALVCVWVYFCCS
jgi:predicted RNA-binding protein with TRAM domain